MCCKEFTAKRVPWSFAKLPGQSFFKTLLSGPLVWSRDSKPFVDWLHVLKVSLTKFLWNRMASRQINNTSSTLRNIRITFFIYYLATRPTLGHYQGDSSTHPMLINAFLSGFDPEVTVTLITRLDFEGWLSA